MTNPAPASNPAAELAVLPLDEAALVAFTQRLVRVRSVIDPVTGATEEQAARLVAAQMREFGWQPEITEAAPGRLNVMAVIEGGRPGPMLAFEGHTDVVTEGDPEAWSFDPFSGDIRDGKLHGRGAADMKSGLAAAIFAVRAVQLSGPFPGRIAVCALADEEGMMLGAKHIAQSGRLAGAAGVIVCEPEGGEICTMAKGAIRLRMDIRGTMAHGAMPHEGKNPISAASSLIGELEHLQESIRAGARNGRPGRGTVDYADGSYCRFHAAGQCDSRQLGAGPGYPHDPGNRPPAAAGRIGDIACRVAARTGTQITQHVVDDRPAVHIDHQHPLVEALAAAHAVVQGGPAPFGYVPGTTDGTILSRDAGLATVVYGPGGKWIAHQADEFVEVAEIGRYAAVYAMAARAFLADPRNRQDRAG